MIPELELLYNKSLESRELARWLKDEELIRDYRETVRFTEQEQEQLLGVLTGKDRELFQHYVDIQSDQTEAERRMLFSQGFAIGLRLGSLCAWC